MGDNKQIIQKITIGKYKWPTGSRISKTCKRFVRALLTLDPHKRLSPKEALEHPFLNGQANDENLGSEFLANLGEFYSGNLLKRMIVDMSRDEKKVMIRAFREIDKDRSGFLEENEIVEYLIKCGKSRRDAEASAKDLMKTMGADERGRVSLQDFVRAKTVSKLSMTGDEGIQAIYNKLCQSDNIEGLAAQALKEWMLKNDQTLTEHKVDAFIKGVDKDGDGAAKKDKRVLKFNLICP